MPSTITFCNTLDIIAIFVFCTWALIVFAFDYNNRPKILTIASTVIGFALGFVMMAIFVACSANIVPRYPY